MPPGVGVGQLSPDPDTSELLCLHGPDGACAHLWQFQTNYRHGNPVGTFKEGEEPRHDRRICLRGHEEMDLAGGAVYQCNRYEGGAPALVQLERKAKK